MARLISPVGAVDVALRAIVRLYGQSDPVEDPMDLFLQALLSGPSATDSAIDEILFICDRNDYEAQVK